MAFSQHGFSSHVLRHALTGGGLAVCAALLVGLFPSITHACPICFQAEDTQTINGVRAGVIVLMSVTVAVLTAVAVFAIRVWRSEKLGRPDA
jgi:glycerol-3-phosphate acyltransferase PlsY